MLSKALLGEKGINKNFDLPRQNKIFFPDDSTEKLFSNDLEFESFFDKGGIEHVRVFKSAYTTSETDELWEIYSYDDEAMPLELNICQNEDFEN